MGRLAAAVVLLILSGCVLPRPIHGSPTPTDLGPAVAKARAGEPVPASPRVGNANWTTFGWSNNGRPLRLSTAGHGPRRVLWVGGIHGDEREGSVATASLPAAFAGQSGLAAAVTLTIVEDANPDGSVASSRHNARGVDLNRNFPASNFRPSARTGRRPLDQPEAKALHDLIMQLAPDLVIVSHSASAKAFINWDGPAEAAARRFSELSGHRLVASGALHSTPGSLGSWLGRDRGVSILTLEYQRGEDAAAAWLRTRSAILAVIAGTT